jgi:hypothetical protein
MNIANALGEVAYRTVRVGDLDVSIERPGRKRLKNPSLAAMPPATSAAMP